MIVKELIKKLEQCDPNKIVTYISRYASCPVEITNITEDIDVVYIENRSTGT